MRTAGILFLCAIFLPVRLFSAKTREGGDGSNAQDHWAFRPLTRPELPHVQNAGWIRTPIDPFVLSRLEREGVRPSPEAERTTLIRRLSFDLTGLPPATEDVELFLSDASPDAYPRLVDRLLASPHFGERWGRHWLDLARYADSDGYEKDTPRPYAYLYRDWVIDAINRDLPFDRFTMEQLAGDLLPGAAESQRIATGFHRNTLTNKEGGVDQEEFRCKATVDRTSTTGTVWLGLTVGCAECHNHKYDPLSQRDFYRLYAFFNDASEKELPVPLPAEIATYEREKAAWEARQTVLKDRLTRHAAEQLSKNQTEWEQHLWDSDDLWTVPDQILTALFSEITERTEDEQRAVADFFQAEIDPVARELERQLSDHAKREPKFPPRKAPILAADQRKTQIHIRGDFLRKGDEVDPGFPEIFDRNARFRKSAQPTRRSDRLDLAQWLVAPENPLPARVAANRIWYHLFGRGLVATLDDFGIRGERPSHPELLDWLATEYRRLGWSRKAMIKLIVTSRSYRQSSRPRTDLIERDPNNVLLARQNRIRMEAETVRDAFLRASGLLAAAIGGPSIRPPLPADIAALGYANSIRWAQDEGAGRYRRGLYIFFQRTVPYPMLMTFDAPDSNVTCTRRERSNTPLQALTLLNDPVFFECAQALGAKLAAANAATPSETIRLAFLACLSRPPSDLELDRLEKLYRDQLTLTRENPDRTAQIARVSMLNRDAAEIASWILVARTVMNLDEFITRE